MKLTLTDDSNTVLEEWDTEDEIDLDVFYAIARVLEGGPIHTLILKLLDEEIKRNR